MSFDPPGAELAALLAPGAELAAALTLGAELVAVLTLGAELVAVLTLGAELVALLVLFGAVLLVELLHADRPIPIARTTTTPAWLTIALDLIVGLNLGTLPFP